MSKLALVLQGGGSRGAYEAGVLRFLLDEVAPRLDKPLRFDLISGTSVGALNGCWVAGRGPTREAGRRLSRVWRNLTVHDVWRFDTMDLLRSPSRLFSGDPKAGASFLDASPLHRLVTRLFPFAGMHEQIGTGKLDAVVLASTEVATGRSVLFVQHGAHIEPGWIPYPEIDVRSVTIEPMHALASSAIPFLFPPVDIGGLSYVDGGVRQNTPISPVLRLGAEKVLVLGVKRPFQQRSLEALEDVDDNPNLVFLLGKVLNAFMLDPIEQDLSRLERLNKLFEWGEEAYGQDFLEGLNKVVAPKRGAPYRKVESLIVRPREDLGRVCAQIYRRSPPETSRATRLLLDLVSDREGEEADFMSYLLFDTAYTSALERLGWEDARDMEEELGAFLSD